MKKICFITGSRADYGIMAPIMKKIADSPDAELQIIATNMHLSAAHGMTVREIEHDGFIVNSKIDSLFPGDSPSSTVKSMAAVQSGLADAFPILLPDLVVILGDRYEALSAASAAVTFGIPVAHLHGGETTEGAVDDFFRHAITKLSTLHFASTAEYARRIVQMGEAKERVFHTGAPGVQNVIDETLLSLEELEKSLGFSLDNRYVVVTFHPATKNVINSQEPIEPLFDALDKIIKDGYKVLFTMPNSDAGGLLIADKINGWASLNKDNVLTAASLGRKRFFSALANASAIIGNSSSGIIEAPTFHIPTINIGDRQKGRTQGPSIINCRMDASQINYALNKAVSPHFRDFLYSLPLEDINPYYKEGSINQITRHLLHSPLPITKPFIDL